MRSLRSIVVVMSLASLPIGLARPAFAAAGDLDTSFSGDGKLTTDFGSKQDFALGLALQADGKIVAAGVSAANGTNPKFALTRYNDDGTLDTTFSGDGKVTTDFQSGNLDAANGVVAQSDGEIVAAGLVYTSQTDAKFALIRYNSDGTLDTTFSGDGKVKADFTNGADSAQGVGLLSDGRIVAAGIADSGATNAKFAVAMFTADGDLDTSFSGDGKVTTDFGSNWDGALGVTVQADDKIVAAGESGFFGSNPKFAVARYNTDGSLDTSFSADGKVNADLSSKEDYALDVAMTSDGRVVAAGIASADGSNPTFGLARFATDGTLDTTFDGDGKVTTDFTSAVDYASGVAIQGDDKIVAVGASGIVGSNPKFAIARYTTAGALDTTFSGDGKSQNDITSETDSAEEVAIQADGKIVAAGGAGDTNTMFALTRWLAA